MKIKNCILCNTDNQFYLQGDSCWDKIACSHRSKIYSNPAMEEDKECFTTDNEQMRVALLKIMEITGHDHSNPIYNICCEALPSDQD